MRSSYLPPEIKERRRAIGRQMKKEAEEYFKELQQKYKPRTLPK
jgi:deoxyadenosine/deoxycytidine kinase